MICLNSVVLFRILADAERTTVVNYGMSGIASVRMIVNMQLSCSKQLSGGLGHPKYLDWVTAEVSEVWDIPDNWTE